MPIAFSCPHCGKRLKAPDEYAGRKASCSGCGARVVIPSSRAPRESAAAPAAEQPQPALAAESAPARSAALRSSSTQGGAPETPLMPPRPKAEHHPEELVDMTSMVDVVFFLLIFFLVTSMQGLQSAIAMPHPDPQKASARGARTISDFEADRDYVIVRIDRDDTIWLDEDEIHSPQELITRLREARESGGAAQLLVLGSAEASHGAAVTVLDAGADAGMEGVRLAIDETP